VDYSQFVVTTQVNIVGEFNHKGHKVFFTKSHKVFFVIIYSIFKKKLSKKTL